jgi:hypothetical protein
MAKKKTTVKVEKDVTDITRYVKPTVERELWGRSAGRCQFDGHNKLLYKSSVTQDAVNIAEKAHIYAFSTDGARGNEPYKDKLENINEIENLMLLCEECHKLIDKDTDGTKYSAKLLQEWKKAHEERIEIVTAIKSDKKSHVVFYGSNIGDEKSPIQKNLAIEAMFPNHYPAEERPIILSMDSSHEDKSPEFWEAEEKHLVKMYQRHIETRIQENNPSHFSVFAFATIPLLIKLGTLFTDKISVDTYQPTKEPKTWSWQDDPDDFEFIINEPKDFTNPPVLIVSLSDKISHERVTSVVGKNISIWEITVAEVYRHNDFIKHPNQLSKLRTSLRKLMAKIREKHGQKTPLMIFPTMPISCAIEFGRIRMPKAEMPWIIYDQNNKMNSFIKALEIGV